MEGFVGKYKAPSSCEYPFSDSTFAIFKIGTLEISI